MLFFLVRHTAHTESKVFGCTKQLNLTAIGHICICQESVFTVELVIHRRQYSGRSKNFETLDKLKTNKGLNLLFNAVTATKTINF